MKSAAGDHSRQGHWRRIDQGARPTARTRERLRARLNPVIPIVSGIMVVVMGVVTDVSGTGRFTRGPISLEQALLRSPVYFGFGFIGWYLVQLLGFKSYGPRTMICNQCHRVKNEDREPNCSCGGQFEPLDNWEWVEDDDSDTETNANTEE
jgi:hypothetical protein